MRYVRVVRLVWLSPISLTHTRWRLSFLQGSVGLSHPVHSLRIREGNLGDESREDNQLWVDPVPRHCVADRLTWRQGANVHFPAGVVGMLRIIIRTANRMENMRDAVVDR